MFAACVAKFSAVRCCLYTADRTGLLFIFLITYIGVLLEVLTNRNLAENFCTSLPSIFCPTPSSPHFTPWHRSRRIQSTHFHPVALTSVLTLPHAHPYLPTSYFRSCTQSLSAVTSEWAMTATHMTVHNSSDRATRPWTVPVMCTTIQRLSFVTKLHVSIFVSCVAVRILLLLTSQQDLFEV